MTLSLVWVHLVVVLFSSLLYLHVTGERDRERQRDREKERDRERERQRKRKRERVIIIGSTYMYVMLIIPKFLFAP